MPPPHDTRIYEALVIPNEALDRGGMEILRAGLVDDELYVTARRVFKDPATWGEILGEITQRLGRIYAAEGEYKAKEVIAAIESAYAAEMGATPIAARVMEQAFDYLDAPVARVAGKDVPMPYAANLEKLALPSVAEVVAAAKAVSYR